MALQIALNIWSHFCNCLLIIQLDSSRFDLSFLLVSSSAALCNMTTCSCVDTIFIMLSVFVLSLGTYYVNTSLQAK